MEDSDNPGPAVQRRRLRAELRRARLDAGLTQEQVAAAMDWSLSKLIRIENGSVNISTNDLKAILQHYKINDENRTSELIALSRAARERSWWSTYRDSAPPRLLQLLEYEAAAFISRNFQPLVMPGLLQTEEYARISIRQLDPRMSASRFEALVGIRMKRQELLQRVDAPLLFFVMDESVVRRIVGGKDVMRRQVQKLIDASQLANVTIEIVPFSAGLLPGLQGQFLIYEFPDAADDDVLYLEHERGTLLSRDDTDEILKLREEFEKLREASLGPEGSIDFLRTVAGELGLPAVRAGGTKVG
jgi:transcriptional regulator with XRE-family HTH domain